MIALIVVNNLSQAKAMKLMIQININRLILRYECKNLYLICHLRQNDSTILLQMVCQNYKKKLYHRCLQHNNLDASTFDA